MGLIVARGLLKTNPLFFPLTQSHHTNPGINGHAPTPPQERGKGKEKNEYQGEIRWQFQSLRCDVQKNGEPQSITQ
ncbi:MAG: hypothetical protein ABIU05_07705 [Nitrospirales bacterium]